MQSQPTTYEDYAAEFWELYGHIDKQRTPEGMWLRLVESASTVGEAVRELNEAALDDEEQEFGNFSDIFVPLADVFCWVTNFITHCVESDDLHFIDDVDVPITFDESSPHDWIIWEKYPGYCLSCDSLIIEDPVEADQFQFDIHPCRCYTERPNRTKSQRVQSAFERAENISEHRPHRVDDYVDMLSEIYGQKYRGQSLEFITFHFLEEVGEVSEQIRKLTGIEEQIRQSDSSDHDEYEAEKAHLRRELADVYSWISAVIIQLDHLHSQTNGLECYTNNPGGSNVDIGSISLETVINERYLNEEGDFECPRCNQTRCNPDMHTADFVYP